MSDGRIALGPRPAYWPRAIEALSTADPVLARVIATSRSQGLRRRKDPFLMLARAIIGQQISTKAADSIWLRLAEGLGGISPGTILAAGDAGLRALGLTRQKASYFVVLAEAARDGRLDAARLRRLADEKVIEELIALKGIGRWTAEMFLMFHLQRPDVLPLGDLGLRRAIGLCYAEGGEVALDDMRTLAETWRPWRSVATWYLWRSMDTPD